MVGNSCPEIQGAATGARSLKRALKDHASLRTAAFPWRFAEDRGRAAGRLHAPLYFGNGRDGRGGGLSSPMVECSRLLGS